MTKVYNFSPCTASSPHPCSTKSTISSPHQQLQTFMSTEDYQRRCVCGADVVLLTSWTVENPGRRFFRCGSMKKGSVSRSRHYFAWFDDPIPFRAKVVINGLLRRLETVENAIDGESILGEELESKQSMPTDSDGIGFVGKPEIPKSQVSVNQHPFMVVCILLLGIVIGKLL